MVALSGGADSVALLRALREIAKTRNWALSACHVHHGIRGESADADARFCEALCRALGVEYREIRLCIPKGSGLAERARAARYEALEREADEWGAERIALAHHADDQAETVLARLGRGAPLGGLAGIPPRRGLYIRPLLGESREAIEHYLEALRQDYRRDPSNRSREAERSRIRHKAIPALEEALRRPVRAALARAATEAAEAEAFLGEEALGVRRRLQRDEKGGGVSFSAAALRRIPAALRKRLWRIVLKDRSPGEQPAARHVEALDELVLLDARRPGARVALPGGESAFIERGRVWIAPGVKKPARSQH